VVEQSDPDQSNGKQHEIDRHAEQLHLFSWTDPVETAATGIARSRMDTPILETGSLDALKTCNDR
jgi:hypothetical protein